MSADLSASIRAALVADADITALLPAYLKSYPVFTRRPAPKDAPYPMIMVSPDITTADADGVADRRPLIERDVAVYGRNDTAEHYRDVETIAYAVRALFHRRWQSLTISGWKVVSVVVRGPQPAPVDDEQTVGRLVSLSIGLARDDLID